MHEVQGRRSPIPPTRRGMFHLLVRTLPDDFVLLALCCVTVTLALVVLWKANDNWLYSSIGHLDTWYYVAYGLYWSDPTFLTGDYKASRLPWVLYEFLHYRLLGPEIAVPVIQLGCYLWLLIGNYVFTRRLFDPLVSSLTSVGLVLWTHIHANAGADYHNTLCGPLFVWCAYATIRPMQERAAAPWFMIAGGLYLALVVTNPHYLNLSPALVILGLFPWLQRQRDYRYLLMCCFWVVFGAAVTFLMLGLVNLLDGRRFLFIEQLVSMTKFLVFQGGNRWWKGWDWWILDIGSVHLGSIAAMLIIAGSELALLFRLRRWDSTNRGAALLHTIYIFHVLLWIIWQSAGQTTLDYDYFAYPLWVPWFWSLAAVLAVRVPHLNARLSHVVSGFAIITLAVLAVVSLLYGSSLHALALRQFHYTLFQAGLAMIAFYLLLVGTSIIRAGAIVATFVVVFPLVNLLSEGASWYGPTACRYGRDGFRSVINASQFISRSVAIHENALLWFDETEAMPNQPHCPRNIGYNLFGYLLVGFGTLGPWWPMKPIEAIPADAIQKAADPRYVVAIVTSAPSNVEKLSKRFAEQGILVNLIDHRDFNSETIAYSVYLLRSATATK
jgi:hypothetical protein